MRICSIPGCGQPYEGHGLCNRHYKKWKKYGDPHAGYERRKNGEGKVHRGFIVKTYGDQRAYEHVHIMSQYLGRPLRDDERIRHLNGDRADNRLDNLLLIRLPDCTSSKECTRCHQVKPLDAFAPRGTGRAKRHSACIECNHTRTSELRQDPAVSKRLSERGYFSKIKCQFGLDRDTYSQMLSGQEGKCAICRQLPSKKKLSVDHCHATGRVRGLLCTTCNSLLGRCKDNPQILRLAVEYLRCYKK
jgi:hypothetical protein